MEEDYVRPKKNQRSVKRKHLYIAGAMMKEGGIWRSAKEVVKDILMHVRRRTRKEINTDARRSEKEEDPDVVVMMLTPKHVQTCGWSGRDEMYMSFDTALHAAQVMEILCEDEPKWEVRYASTALEQRRELEEKEEEEKRRAGHVHKGSVEMNSLIPGLAVVEEFLSAQCERELLLCIDEDQNRTGTPGISFHDGDGDGGRTTKKASVSYGRWDHMKRRRVKHFGHKFSYVHREVDWGEGSAPEFPPCCVALKEEVARFAAHMADIMGNQGWVGIAEKVRNMDQLTVNEYTPRVRLSPHCDSHRSFQDIIVIVSVAGHTVFEFRNDSNGRHALMLAPRSLLIIHGEARYGWEHYIPHRKEDWINGELVQRPPRRVSFTMRERRRKGEGCSNCQFKHYCDDSRMNGGGHT